MKISKFDYNTKKNIFFDIFKKMSENEEIYNDTFCNGKLYEYSNFSIAREINSFEKRVNDAGLNIPEFIIEYKDLIYKDDDFTANCGFIDAFLYKYDKKQTILAGYYLNDSSNEEYYVKYKYGYYKYDMGKNFILQSYKTFEDYYKDTAKLVLIGYFNAYYGAKDDYIIKNQIIKEYNDGYVVFANLKLLFESCKEKFYDRFIHDIKNDFEYGFDHFDIIDDILIITINIEDFDINNTDFEDIKNDFDILNQSHLYNL